MALITLAILSPLAYAQAGDATDRLKKCAKLEGMERLKCVDELLGEAAEPTTPAPPRAQNWIISETTSPVDYKPQIAAQTMGRPATKDAPSSISIRCRASRTELMIATSPSWKQPPEGEVKVVYQVNDDPSIEDRWRAAEGGRSLAFQGDVVRLLRSLPEDGRLLIRVYAGKTPPYESTFQLTGLDSVRRKLATACGWPRA
ncbi:type VI secretion system-associated protein TagO [Bradyrhizobium sp. WSM3983]|uniref:type VI secretion system-associated protein TagO n=1 Tax=Bradyrhizobium sp. WSM3983 TaxID=1038867 RepID=UPI0003FE3891|nr:type VI secretion system-associated protein TagO [Bradyrhizobium sp. WSM3983]